MLFAREVDDCFLAREWLHCMVYGHDSSLLVSPPERRMIIWNTALVSMILLINTRESLQVLFPTPTSSRAASSVVVGVPLIVGGL